MSGSGREVLPQFREWSGVHLRGLRVVGRSFHSSGSGQEALPEAREL